MTTGELAAWTGVPRRKVQRWIQRDGLPARNGQIDPDEFAQWAVRHTHVRNAITGPAKDDIAIEASLCSPQISGLQAPKFLMKTKNKEHSA